MGFKCRLMISFLTKLNRHISTSRITISNILSLEEIDYRVSQPILQTNEPVLVSSSSLQVSLSTKSYLFEIQIMRSLPNEK